jgi:hypothetical protein
MEEGGGPALSQSSPSLGQPDLNGAMPAANNRV